ncbi:MAG TPA: tRNA (guanosine(46)-N7)-methyltransferase TrmB [Phycisphaerae bacterium]|nr:tRNA (guanosine(46)-N7)-methyltransferase TrmB [Phycisphaerae bacterium]
MTPPATLINAEPYPMRSRSGKVHLKATPEELRRCGILLEDLPPGRPFDPQAPFGNRRPVEIEIGTGKGAFLLRRAQQRPEINFLGIEWVPNYACYVADRARRAGLANVRLLRADAETLFKASLPDRSALRIHIYFPDPWPKRKHWSRRLVKVPFLADVRRVLQWGGQLALVTDHEGYFRQIRMALELTDGLVVQEFISLEPSWLVGTNFERKYAAAGKRFFATAAMRCR